MKVSPALSSFRGRTAGIASYCALSALFGLHAWAGESGETAAEETSTEEARVSTTTFGIDLEDASVQISGTAMEPSASGVFIDEKGTIASLATAEVLSSESKVEIEVGGETHQASFLAADKESGLSLFRVEGYQSKPPRFGRSVAMKAGARLFVLSGDGKLVEGKLAGREKGINGFLLSTAYLRIHLAKETESVGGPVYDEMGRVVALIMGASGEAGPVGYALPVEMAEKVRRDFDKFGKVRPVWLGFGLENGTTTPEVKTVAPNSPVGAAGVKPGDILLSIGRREVASYQDVVDACSYLTVRDPVEFKVLRGLEEKAMRVSPGPRPASGKRSVPGK